MKREQLPKWVMRYQNKMKNLKWKLVFMLVCWILIDILLGMLCEFYEDLAGPIAGLGIIGGTFGVLFVFLVGMLGTKMRCRKYGEYYIVFYAGYFKNYLIIEDEVQDSACFESYYYGQLPDGTQVAVKMSQWDGSIKFAIGDSQNLNLTQF